MKSVDDIKRSILKMEVIPSGETDEKTLADLLEAHERSKKTGSNSVRLINVGRMIMKSRLTKLAAATVIIIAIILAMRFIGVPDVASVAWADVVEALDETDNIHWTSTVTLTDGTVYEKEEIWLKNNIFSRREARRGKRRFDTVVDDGKDMLVLNEEDRTAQLSDSPGLYNEEGTLTWFDVFQDKKPDPHIGVHSIALLPQDSNDKTLVYQLKEGKAWVDAGTSLPLKVVLEYTDDCKYSSMSEEERDRREYFRSTVRREMTFDYQAIPDVVFSTAVPEGYEVLPRKVHPEIMFGRVIDQYGRAVVGAQVYTSFRGECKTDANGNFAIRKPPCTSAKSIVWTEFPILVRAFEADDPYRVAWTVIRNPNHVINRVERIATGPAFTQEEWEQRKQKALEYPRTEDPLRIDVRGTLGLIINDEKGFAKCIPGDPGELYGGGGERDPNKVRDIILIMAPGSVITGQVTSSVGDPVANAAITLEEMEIESGKNKVVLRSLGSKNKRSWRAFAVTDYEGYYELHNLPAFWDEVTLRVEADGYNAQELKIKEPGADVAPDEPQIVEGCHIQLVRK